MNSELNSYFRIKNLFLKNFRSHSSISLQNISNRLLIIGENGSGKTSILEAISMFSNESFSFYHGNTLNSNLIKYGENVAQVDLEMEKLNTISLFVSGQKKYTINGKGLEKQSNLTNYIKICSIKSADQYLFLDKKIKRKFFENILENITQLYTELLKQYKILAKQRMIAIFKNSPEKFIDSVEKNLTKIGIEMVKMRKSLILVPENKKISFHYKDPYDDITESDEDRSELFLKIFKDNRALDNVIGKMKFSFHRFEFDIKYNNTSFNQISNSEQKECMYEFFLSSIDIFRQKLSLQPILLIDEVDAFFDDFKIENFVNKILSFPGQIFFTSPTEKISKFIPNLNVYKIQ